MPLPHPTPREIKYHYNNNCQVSRCSGKITKILLSKSPTYAKVNQIYYWIDQNIPHGVTIDFSAKSDWGETVTSVWQKAGKSTLLSLGTWLGSSLAAETEFPSIAWRMGQFQKTTRDVFLDIPNTYRSHFQVLFCKHWWKVLAQFSLCVSYNYNDFKIKFSKSINIESLLHEKLNTKLALGPVRYRDFPETTGPWGPFLKSPRNRYRAR